MFRRVCRDSVAEGTPEVSALQTIHPLPAGALAAPACPHSRAAPGSPTAPPTIGQGKYGLSLHFLMWTAPTPCLPVTMPRRTGLDDPDGQAGSSFKVPAGAPIAYPASLPRGRLFPRQTMGAASGSRDSPSDACSGSISLSGRRDCSPVQSGLVHIYPRPRHRGVRAGGSPRPPACTG